VLRRINLFHLISLSRPRHSSLHAICGTTRHSLHNTFHRLHHTWTELLNDPEPHHTRSIRLSAAARGAHLHTASQPEPCQSQQVTARSKTSTHRNPPSYLPSHTLLRHDHLTKPPRQNYALCYLVLASRSVVARHSPRIHHTPVSSADTSAHDSASTHTRQLGFTHLPFRPPHTLLYAPTDTQNESTTHHASGWPPRFLICIVTDHTEHTFA